MARTGFWRAPVVVFTIAAIAPGAAAAPRADTNVQVAGRILSYLQPPVSGSVSAAIIYQPGDAASENEARSIERALGTGLVVGSLRLQPRRVPVNALDRLAGAKVAFVTRGTDYRAVAAATAPRSILTISSDPACTRAGYCVVTISSAPRLQIIVSKAATRAARLRFNTSFLMLNKEI